MHIPSNFETSFRSRRSNMLATRGMVAASQPLAALAGLDMLRAGGNAADAAVATAAMLNVVEPTSTGIGGDCFALYWHAGDRQVTALNGSGRAAAAASLHELRALGYRAMPTYTGHTVTVPGAVAGWQALLERHGRMTLADVLAPAIDAAERGYPVTEWIAAGWATQVPKLLRQPGWHSGDLDNGPAQPSGHELLLDGRSPRAGELMRLPTLAHTLRGIAAEGPDYFYRGDFAQRLCAHVQRYGGWLTPADLAAHRSTWDEPITANYRGVTLYECPPNGQGLAAILAANLAAGFDLAAMDAVERVHVLVECMRLGFADALAWVADPAPTSEKFNFSEKLNFWELCSPAYTAQRRQRIDLHRAALQVSTGWPRAGDDTVYLAVVDGDGNACSFINSLYMGTGSGLVIPGTGVSLHNRGAGFSFEAGHANALAPNKRPYHTIIPALTTRGGELHACFGVMGGFMQPQGHLQVLSNLIDLGMSPQQALDAPRWRIDVGEESPAGRRLFVEEGWDFKLLAELARRGHPLVPVSGFGRIQFGGGQVILRDAQTGVLIAGSDSRKDGCAIGQ